MTKSFRLQSCPLLALAVLSVVAVAPSLLASPSPQTATPTTQAATPTPQNDKDINRRELRNFDRYLDNHPEVAEQVRKDPSLLNNEDFLEKHPQLKTFLKNHPGVREEAKENPQAFMNRERRFEKHEGNEKEGDTNRRELRNFDQYLDKHPEVAEQIRKNPSLVNNEDWMEKHPQLQKYLKNHPGVREELKENPRAFMKRERRYDKHEGETAEKRDRAENRTKKH